MKCLKMLTFFSLEELAEMEAWDDSRINEKKERLAWHLTALVHGEAEADKAQAAARALFTGGDDAAMPTTVISEAQLENGSIGLLSLLVACGLAASNGEARRLVQQGGIALDDVKAEVFDARVTAEALQKGVKIKKGKKIFHKAILG